MRLTSWTTAGNAIEAPMSRQDIADYRGLTIETVSRTLISLATGANDQCTDFAADRVAQSGRAEPAERLG